MGRAAKYRAKNLDIEWMKNWGLDTENHGE